MKIRSYFVSNSSSSSFVIAFKGDKKELKKELDTIFEVPDKFPLKLNMNQISNLFIQNSERRVINELDEWEIEDIEYQLNKKIDNLLNNKYIIYYGSFCNDSGDSMESMLCDSNISYESDNLIIKKNGGY